MIFITTVLAAISALYFYNERNTEFDKYEDFRLGCIQENKFGRVNLNCKTLLEAIVRKEKNEVCLHFILISTKDKPENLIICENQTKILGLEDPNIYSLQKVPINLEISYKKGLFQIAKFENISITLMPDSEFNPLLADLYSRSFFIKDIRTEASLELEKKKFFTHTLDLPGMENFSILLFTETFVKNFYTEGDYIHFDLEVFVEDYKFNLNVSSEELIFPRVNNDEVILTKNDLSDISIDSKYSTGFIYIPKGTNINLNNKAQICDSYDKNLYILDLFCRSNRTMESLLLEEDVDEYVKKLGEIGISNMENLMFIVIEPYE